MPWVWSRLWSFQAENAPDRPFDRPNLRLTSEDRAIVDEPMGSHDSDAAVSLLAPPGTLFTKLGALGQASVPE